MLGVVCLPAAAASVALNFLHSGHELGNTALVAAAAMMWCGGGLSGALRGGRGGGDGGGGGGSASDVGAFAVMVALSAVPLSSLEDWTRRVWPFHRCSIPTTINP